MRRCLALLLLVILARPAVPPRALADGDVCSDPANRTVNCDMNTFSDHSVGDQIRIVADGWGFWVESGNPAFDVGQDSPVPPSQRIWSDGGAFRVGMYQQVSNLTPGATYVAGVGWVPYTSPDGTIMRQLGVDPTGGTDPLAPTVIWGPEDWRFSRFTNLEVRTVAQGPTMTVFIRLFNPASHGADQIFVDGAWLKQDPNVPVGVPATATSAPPTATSVPPSPTPPPPSATPLPPTATSTPVALAPTATATVLPPTATSLPPTATAIPPTPTPTLTETVEPSATARPSPTVRRTVEASPTRPMSPSPEPSATFPPPAQVQASATVERIAAAATPIPTASVAAVAEGRRGGRTPLVAVALLGLLVLGAWSGWRWRSAR